MTCLTCDAMVQPGDGFCGACGRPLTLGQPASVGRRAGTSGVNRVAIAGLAIGAVALAGAAVFAVGGGSIPGLGGTGGDQIVLTAASLSNEASSVRFTLNSRYTISAAGEVMSGGWDSEGQVDLGSGDATATVTPVGLEADLLDSLATLSDDSDFSSYADGVKVVQVGGTSYTKVGDGEWSSSEDAVNLQEGILEPQAMFDLLDACEPTQVDAAGPGSRVNCRLPLDEQTLSALGADFTAEDLQEAQGANATLDFSFVTDSDGRLSQITALTSVEEDGASATFEVSMGYSDWNAPVDIQAPTSTY